MSVALRQVYQTKAKAIVKDRLTRSLRTLYDATVDHLHGRARVGRLKAEEFPIQEEVRRILRRI